MITRIVRMSFTPEKKDDFLEIFHGAKKKIRAMEGCQYLSLHRDYHHVNVYYTLSKWDSQEALDKYRDSDLFKTTWEATRKCFNEKAQAYSLKQEVELN